MVSVGDVGGYFLDRGLVVFVGMFVYMVLMFFWVRLGRIGYKFSFLVYFLGFFFNSRYFFFIFFV